MKKKVTPYKESDLNKKKQVEKMFDKISENYDGLNRVISFGADVRWRRTVIKQVCNTNPKTVLDIATGSGDLAIQFAEKLPKASITGLDLSEGMLNIARKKIANTNLEQNLEFIKGDSEELPFADNSFEAVTVSFRIRNFEDLEKELSEIKRILTHRGILD